MYYEFHSLKPAIRPFYNHKILQKEVAYDGHCFHIIVNWRRSIHKCQVQQMEFNGRFVFARISITIK